MVPHRVHSHQYPLLAQPSALAQAGLSDYVTCTVHLAADLCCFCRLLSDAAATAPWHHHVLPTICLASFQQADQQLAAAVDHLSLQQMYKVSWKSSIQAYCFHWILASYHMVGYQHDCKMVCKTQGTCQLELTPCRCGLC